MISGSPIAEHVQQVELKLRPVSDDAIENLPMEDKAAIFFVSGYAGEHSNTNFIILNHLNCCKAVILIYRVIRKFLTHLPFCRTTIKLKLSDYLKVSANQNNFL